MIARIKTINLDSYEDSIEERETLPVTTSINFKVSEVSAYYIITDGDDKFLYTNVSGIEYPLIYESYLEKVLEAEINKEEV